MTQLIPRIEKNCGFALMSLAVALSLFACGRRESSLNDSGAELIKIMVPPLQSQAKFFLVSTPAGATNVKVCIVGDNDCTGATVSLSPLKTVGSRALFTGKFVLASSATYKVMMTNNGSDVSRLLPFQAGEAYTWKSVFMAGSANNETQNGKQRVVAWDNARRDVAASLAQRGYVTSQMRHLSRDTAALSKEANIRMSSLADLNKAFESLQISANEACFLFMTSHGSQSGFSIEDGDEITPAELNATLDQYCGTRPTVAIVSACYSGINLTPSSQKPNRVIFTAASANKTSNGCDASLDYTFFDECLLGAFKSGATQTWNQLGAATKACIDNKETAENRSEPQFWIGDQMQNKAIAGNTAPVKPEPLTPDSTGGGSNQNQGPVQLANNIDNLTKVDKSKTSLAAVASGATYLFVDFSASWCGPCQQMATEVAKNAKLFENDCHAATIVDANDLDPWARVAGGAIAHSFELPSSMDLAGAYSALTKKNISDLSLPTMLLIDAKTGAIVNEAEGTQSLDSFLQGKCHAKT